MPLDGEGAVELPVPPLGSKLVAVPVEVRGICMTRISFQGKLASEPPFGVLVDAQLVLPAFVSV